MTLIVTLTILGRILHSSSLLLGYRYLKRNCREGNHSLIKGWRRNLLCVHTKTGKIRHAIRKKIFICRGNTKLNGRITKHETKIYGKQMVLVFALHILNSPVVSDSISWVTTGWSVATQWRK